MNRIDKYLQHSPIVWAVGLNGLLFLCELNATIESGCNYLNFKFRACFEQNVI